MSLGGENIAGFLRGFGGLLQLSDGDLTGVEILGARFMPSASQASFRTASALPVPGDPGFTIVPGIANELLFGILLAIGGIAFALIFGEEIAREVRSRLRL